MAQPAGLRDGGGRLPVAPSLPEPPQPVLVAGGVAEDGGVTSSNATAAARGHRGAQAAAGSTGRAALGQLGSCRFPGGKNPPCFEKHLRLGCIFLNVSLFLYHRKNDFFV